MVIFVPPNSLRAMKCTMHNLTRVYVLMYFLRAQSQASKKPWHNDNPFIVMKVNRRISRCTGCCGLLPKNADKSPPPPPPWDLVVQHVEKDEYPFKDLITGAVEKRVSSEKPKYYHPNPSCIIKRHPYFNPSMLCLQKGLSIDSLHRDYLSSTFRAVN